MEYDGYILHEGKLGERQQKILERLHGQDIVSTMYVDEDCLFTLGICHSIFHMLNILGMHDIFDRK